MNRRSKRADFTAEGTAGHRRKHRDFVGVDDHGVLRCRVAVDPDSARREDADEWGPVASAGDRQYFANGVARHRVASDTGGFSRRCKEPKGRHAAIVPLPSQRVTRSTDDSIAERSASTPKSARNPTRLLVARHGQSEWNAVGRWQGQADPPLSEEGRLQAADAGLRLGTFDAIWASDLQRASLTAEIIASIIGIGPVLLDQRLRETHVGPWEGLTHDEVNTGWPGFLDNHRRPDGFEPYDDAAARMIECFVDIARASPGGEVLVIGHGGAIRAARRALGAVDAKMANLGGSWFTVDGAQIRAGEVVDLAGAASTGMAL